MVLANSMVTPEIGTIFWTTFIFLILLGLLRAFAWKPMLKAIKAREDSIKSSLEAADEARSDMGRLLADNEAIMKEAREEREILLKETRSAKDKMINEARDQAKAEAEKLIEKARIGIEREKAAAITEFRNQVATLSVEIAEKILRAKLGDKGEHERLVNDLLDEVDLTKN